MQKSITSLLFGEPYSKRFPQIISLGSQFLDPFIQFLDLLPYHRFFIQDQTRSKRISLA